MRQKGFAHLILIFILVLILIGGLVAYKKGYLQNSINSKVPATDVTQTPTLDISQLTETPTNPPSGGTRRVSDDTTLPHEYLPGFNITYPNTWKIAFKQFFTEDTMNFEPGYFATCHGQCMGIRLTKGNVYLDFKFDLVLDQNGERCIDKKEFNSIGLDWYEIKDQKGYFYVDYPTKYIAQPQLKEVCIAPEGDSLKDYSPADPNYGVLMEYPYLRGNPDAETLKEVHSIILSIKGLEEKQ